MRVTPDDEVYRVNTVWLGPTGLTFPWTARYSAYAMWLVIFLGILLVERLLPGLSVQLPPVWEICIATLATYGLMGFVDHEQPFASVIETLRAELKAPRATTESLRVHTRATVRVRSEGKKAQPYAPRRAA